MKLSTRILLPIALTVAAGASFAEGPIQGNEVFAFTSQASQTDVRGQAIAARNAGLAHVRTPYVALVDCDVTVGTDLLLRLA